MSKHPLHYGAFAKAARRELCYSGIPITESVHDNHFCAVNPFFIAVVTECYGGGAFLVIPIHKTGRLDPHLPRVCGHKANVLDVKWNPFDDFCIASCSEDTTVKVWEIPEHGLLENIIAPWKELQGHTQRVGLIEWHPAARGVLLSSAYDCTVMLWNLDTPEKLICNPVKTISFHPHVVICMCLSSDGSLLATACRDRQIRLVEPRSGALLQETSRASHKVNKVLFLGDLKMLLSTGSSEWNQRHVVLWDQEDLSNPLVEEELDDSCGVLFPFYDPDTHMVYVAGKGDGNIRCYEISPEKPYVHFLFEYRSTHPQKGLGVMPKMGLSVFSSEVFRFYRLLSTRNLIEPLSVFIPRKLPHNHSMARVKGPALTAQEWLSGKVHNMCERLVFHSSAVQQPSQLLLMLCQQQQDEIHQLLEMLSQKGAYIEQLEMELKHCSPRVQQDRAPCPKWHVDPELV